MAAERQVNKMHADEAHATEWLPAYALNILTEAETTQVAEHLAICPACQAELRLYQAAADELPLALAQAVPRPALKDRLMKEIHSRQVKAVGAPNPTFWQRWAGFFQRSAPAWAMALIMVLALGNLLLWFRLNQASGRDATPMMVVALAGTKDSTQAIGTLVMNPTGEYGSLVVDHLAVLDAGHQYQVWLIKDVKRTSGGVFSVNPDGYASLELYAPLPINQYQSIGITIEPAGGSPGPTGAKVLGGDL
jgi:anti-sigma-K factor RskA